MAKKGDQLPHPKKTGRFSMGHSGLTLVELIIASGFALIILIAVLAIFVAGLNVEAHLGGELGRNRDIGILVKNLGFDIRETDLKYATSVTGDQKALSLPTARALDTEFFITDNKTGFPRWKRLRIYYIPSGATQLMRMELSPLNPEILDPKSKKFDLPIKEADLRKYITEEDGYSDKYTLVSRRKIIGNIDNFEPTIVKTDYENPVGETLHRWYLDLTIGIFYKERGKKEAKKAVITRKIFSDNSMYQEQDSIPPSPPTPTPNLTPFFDS